MEYLFIIFLALSAFGKSIAFTDTIYYSTGLVVLNTGTLYNLGNGFTGRYTSIHSNGTGLSVFYYGLWFVNATYEEYYLCLLEFSNINTPFDPAPAQITWCANSDGLIHTSVSTGATLKFQTDGNLVLRDSQGASVFETGTSGRGVTYLGIDYWVNMQLLTSDYTYVWKSYDSPINTLVVLEGFSNETKLTSWLSATNNSQGPYTMVMERGGLVLYFEDSPYWVFSDGSMNTIQSVKTAKTQAYAYLWAGNGYRAELRLSSNYGPLYTSGEVDYSDTEWAQAFTLGSNVLQSYTITTFIKLESDGNLGAYFWNYDNSNWSKFFHLFDDICDLPASCGDYGLCIDGKCYCPPSFVAQNLSLGCELGKDATGFQDLKGATYFSNQYTAPDYAVQNSSACKSLCEKSTSCAAAFYNQTSYSCYFVEKVRTIKSVSDQTCVAFLKLAAPPPSPNPSASHHNSVGIVVGSILGSLAFIIIITVVLRSRKICLRRKGNKQAKTGLELESHPSMSPMAILQEHNQQDQLVGPVRYKYSEIEEITSGFSMLIGQGGFAKVYKGVIQNYGDVAVKVLDATWYQEKDFSTEMSILGRIHHVNLVELIGYCSQQEHRVLVYEYLPNGSLDKWIFGHFSSLLSWDLRFKIALGVAQGMAYLHDGCRDRVLHLDLKPQNILLDSNFFPKVADFGLSKWMNKDQSIMMTNTIRGTPGYVAPDLLVEGGVTYKMDVYSYGIVVLEIISGQKSTEISDKLSKVLIYDEGNEDEESHLQDLIDVNIQSSIDRKQASRLVRVAFLCAQRDPTSRPPMTGVVQMLQGFLPVPSLLVAQRRLLSLDFCTRNTSKNSTSTTSNGAGTSSSIISSILQQGR